MQYDQFIARVQKYTQLISSMEAETLTGAVLQTLAERLSGNEPYQVASELPRNIQGYLTIDGASEGEAFSIEEFFQRVSERTGIDDLVKAKHHAQIVMQVLSEAISAGEMNDIQKQLPPEFGPLFQVNQGQIRVDV